MTLVAQSAVLRHSDVVFMYQADRDTYQAYGATVLAWGGKPTPKSLAESHGIMFFGSVGMVTEFGRFYERFPKTYDQALCRDVHGQPVKVPWLTDHQHKGVPFWWCCTQQPQFREYLKERVIETIQSGAHGIHIDDHMGSAGGLWLGLCFCDRCVEGFRLHVASLPARERQRLGITSLESLDYRRIVARWMEEDGGKKRRPSHHPWWDQWTIYQCRAAAGFMQELRELAARTAGRPVPMGANAGLLWPRHLADYKSLDLFSAETDHHAKDRQFSNLPLFAYRMADAVRRPYAATASGGDWAYVAAHQLPGLVRGWIALAYAAGHSLMAPHHQWCYTPEKGTHWYDGPAEKFAPLYQFVRKNAVLFDGYETFADIAVVLPHRSFVKEPSRWFALGQGLAEKNLSYRLLLAGDEIVDHRLSPDELRSSRALLIPERGELLSADSQTLEEYGKNQPIYSSVADAVAALKPAVQLQGDQRLRLLPRIRPGSAVIHLLNYNYDPSRDDVIPLANLRIKVDRKTLGLPPTAECRLAAPGEKPCSLEMAGDTVEIPTLGLWGVLSFNRPE